MTDATIQTPVPSGYGHQILPPELESILHGHYRFQFLNAAHSFGLFALLGAEPGLTRAQIADRLHLANQPTRILLLGCTATGLLRKDGDRYLLTEVSGSLASKPEDAPSALVAWEQAVSYPSMSRFFESLRDASNVGLSEIPGESPTVYGRLAENPPLERIFQSMIGAVSRAAAADLVETLDLSGRVRLLDVGGGSAINATTLARRWPQLRVTIAEVPSVVERANAHVGQAGLADRVTAVGLDVFTDEFPSGCDCVLFGHFLEIWSAERNATLLRKAAHVLPSGGAAFILAPYQADDETGPELAAVLSAYFLTIASGEGMAYTGREYEQWLDDAGFAPTGRSGVGGLGDVVISGVKR